MNSLFSLGALYVFNDVSEEIYNIPIVIILMITEQLKCDTFFYSLEKSIAFTYTLQRG